MYPQYYPTQPTVPQMQQASQSNSPIWVQGEAGAKSYLVAPGTTVALWDSESTTVYLKSADASGMPSIKILDYTIRDGTNGKRGAEFATKEDVSKEISRLENMIRNMSPKANLSSEQAQ